MDPDLKQIYEMSETEMKIRMVKKSNIMGEDAGSLRNEENICSMKKKIH